MGNRTTIEMPGTPWNAWATALPVSPEVAVRMTSEPSPRLTSRPSSRPIIRAAKSLNEAVGPWSRRSTWWRSTMLSTGTA